MKMMKKTVALVLMSFLATGMIACDQKKEKAEVTPAEKAAPAVEHQAPAVEEQAPAAAEEQAPAAEGQQTEVPSPDAPQGEEHAAPAAEGAPSQH